MSICTSRNKYTDDFYRNVVEGRIPGINPINEFGHNDAIGTTRETLHLIGGDYYWLPSAQQLKVYSDSENDTLTGTGAQIVEIQGLDSDFLPITEEVELNGTTAVTTSNSFNRLCSVEVIQAGSLNTNDDQIYVDDNGEVNTKEVIEAGKGRSHSATYTTPANRTSYIAAWFGFELSNKGVKIEIWKKERKNNPWESVREAYLLGTSFDRAPVIPFYVPEKTDVEIKVVGLQSGSKATGGFEGY